MDNLDDKKIEEGNNEITAKIYRKYPRTCTGTHTLSAFLGKRMKL